MKSDEFRKLGKDEQITSLKNDLLKNLERSIQKMAHMRAIALSEDFFTEDEINDFITKKGAEYGAKYEGKNSTELAILGLMEMFAEDPSMAADSIGEIFGGGER